MIRELSYSRLFKLLISKWHWLLLSLGVGLTIAWIYLRLASPIYSASIFLKFDERKSELAELTNIRNLYERNNKIESEQMILRSSNVMTQAFKSLNLDIAFYIKKPFKLINLYPKKPLQIRILHRSSIPIPTLFHFKGISQREFSLSFEDLKLANRDLNCKYGQTINIGGISFTIYPVSKMDLKQELIFKFNHEQEFIEQVIPKLKITDFQNANVLKISFQDQNRYFTADLLNSIGQQYLLFDKSLRAASAAQTEVFITQMLHKLSKNVKNSALELQRHNERHPSPSSSELKNKLSVLETQQRDLDLQRISIALLRSKIPKTEDSFNLELQGINDPQLIQLLEKFNKVLDVRQAQQKQFKRQSPVIIDLDVEISNLKTNIENNLRHQDEALSVKREYLNHENRKLSSQIQEQPAVQRELTVLQSEFDVQQKVNSYLAEKKLEAQISKAAVTAGAVLVDAAQYAIKPIFPQAATIYFTSGIMALICSTLIIFGLRFSNTRIHRPEEIEDFTDIPLIGIIHHHPKSDQQPIPILNSPRSPTAESLRGLRSNLNFLSAEQSCKVICISSEISAEGKSFVALNLAFALSMTSKRILLIAADLRKSHLHDTLGLSNQQGLSNYLAGQISATAIIQQLEWEHIHFIPSGSVPPNPSELLLNEHMARLLLEQKPNYDFILIDSAPIGLVSDAKALIKLAELNLFVLRSGRSRYNFLKTPEKLKKELQLNNISLVLNDFKEDPYHASYYKNKGGTAPSGNYQYALQQPKYQDYFEL